MKTTMSLVLAVAFLLTLATLASADQSDFALFDGSNPATLRSRALPSLRRWWGLSPERRCSTPIHRSAWVKHGGYKKRTYE